MDIKLLNQVKRLTKEIKKEYDGLCGKSPQEVIKKEVALIYEVVKKNVEGLYRVKENIIINNNGQYEECIQSIRPFICNMFKLSIHFIREQDYNINLTDERMQNGDRDAYLKDERFKAEMIALDGKNYEEEHDEAITVSINEYIERLIQDTNKRYVKSFGLLNDMKLANKLIEKEYYDSIKYIEVLLIMRELVYENFDNFDMLISAIQNITYEVIQLNAVLEQAKDLKYRLINRHLPKSNKSQYVCFVIMDGVNSTKNDSIEKIADNTMALNLEIAKSDKLKLLCKFRAYKQDEVHGYVLVEGDEKEFLDIVDRVYETKMKVALTLRPYSEIHLHLKNVHKFVYNMPFSLHGDICSEARKNMQEKKYIILGGKKPICNFQQRASELKKFVDDTYINSGGADEQINKFIEHNNVILKYVEYLCYREQIQEADYQRIVLAAILHDVSKFEVELVKHGFQGAKVAAAKMAEMGFDKGDIEIVSNAIERHIGPVPGFMQGEANKWEKACGEKIILQRPENTVDKLLYDADMLSLIDKRGIEKILYLRPIYQMEEDEAIATEYGISIEEATWMSVFKIVDEVLGSVYTTTAKEKALELRADALELYEDFKMKVSV